MAAVADPLLNVIVTTFNREKHLSQAVDAILSQTVRSLEVIVVDNPSDYH